MKLKKVLSINNSFYKILINGVNSSMEGNFEEKLSVKEKRQGIITKSIAQLIVDGFTISDDDIEKHFTQDHLEVLTKNIQ